MIIRMICIKKIPYISTLHIFIIVLYFDLIFDQILGDKIVMENNR